MAYELLFGIRLFLAFATILAIVQFASHLEPEKRKYHHFVTFVLLMTIILNFLPSLQAFAFFKAGKKALEDGDMEKGRSLLEKAAKIERMAPQALRFLAYSHILEGQAEKAQKYLDKVIEISPSHSPERILAHFMSGENMMRLKKENMAEYHLLESTKGNFFYDEAYIALGAFYLGKGQIQKVKETFRLGFYNTKSQRIRALLDEIQSKEKDDKKL